MKPRKKKTPADYPVLRFTTTEDTYGEIMNRLESLAALYNENLKVGQCRFRGNIIAIEALKKGLSILEKKIK